MGRDPDDTEGYPCPSPQSKARLPQLHHNFTQGQKQDMVATGVPSEGGEVVPSEST